METNKILTASILDLLFDNRNKDYGAYELRKTYQQRIIKSLVLSISIAGLVYAGAALANSIMPHSNNRMNITSVVLTDIPPQKLPEKIPDQPKPQPLVRTVAVTLPVIVNDNEVEHSMPTKEDVDSSKIGVTTKEGISDNRITGPTEINDGTGVVDAKSKDKDEGPFTIVQVEAKYAGDWKRFLERNLRANVPVDNGAPAGKYTIIIQFIVDVEGTVSSITPLTHLGYGMEEEAVRVLKKADKWEPAFQNGIHVKAYRRQPITFEVLTDE